MLGANGGRLFAMLSAVSVGGVRVCVRDCFVLFPEYPLDRMITRYLGSFLQALLYSYTWYQV